MDDVLRIKDLPNRTGETITLRAWVERTRSSGKIAFVVLRDGTGYLQCVVPKNEVDATVWEAVKTLTQETSVQVSGGVRADARSPGGVELGLRELEVIGESVDFPITPKEHGTAFLFEHRHLWLRSRRQGAIMKVRHEVIQAIRDFFYERDFCLVDTPLLTAAIGEEAGTLFETDYFDLGKAYLAQTGQLYLEAAAAALGKVYCFGPTFRAEKSKTRRHLTEFWMVEPEVAWYDSDANMGLQEDFVSYIQKHGQGIEWGRDLGAENETTIATWYDKPVFVYNYPKEAKAFYMKLNPDDPRTVLCNDCLAPEGYGEIIGGSQREDDHDTLLARIREEGLPEDAYGWYLDLRKYGTFVHSGFGLGVERTVAWICGIPHVREAIAFPRQMHRIHP